MRCKRCSVGDVAPVIIAKSNGEILFTDSSVLSIEKKCYLYFENNEDTDFIIIEIKDECKRCKEQIIKSEKIIKRS